MLKKSAHFGETRRIFESSPGWEDLKEGVFYFGGRNLRSFTKFYDWGPSKPPRPRFFLYVRTPLGKTLPLRKEPFLDPRNNAKGRKILKSLIKV